MNKKNLMKNEHKLALEITSTLTIFFVLFLSMFLFFFLDSISLKDFTSQLFESKKSILKDNNYFYLWTIVILIIVWTYFISYFYSKNLFKNTNKYNKKLKEYNHFLAHELKTPISVIYSNLDVLKYWINEDVIVNSQLELQNMKKIIDWLLDYSESIQISDKKSINVENFINKHIFFLNEKNKIKIINKEFNFSIETDETLFLRIIKNLIENAFKYSLNGELNIFITKDKLTFENKIAKNISEKEIKLLSEKFYTKSSNNNKWHWLWLSMIKNIVKVLWYEIKVKSINEKFIVEIIY